MQNGLPWQQCYFSCDISVSVVVIVVSFQIFLLQLIFSVTITVIRFCSYSYSYFALFKKDTQTVVTIHFLLLMSTKLENIHFHVQVLSLQQ